MKVREESSKRQGRIAGIRDKQAYKFGMTKYRKNLKISVFVWFRSYLVIFGFVLLRLQEHLEFFDLLIMVLKVFEKIWIWYFILKQTQIILTLDLRQTDPI